MSQLRVKFFATAKNGKLQYERPDVIATYLGGVEGKRLEIQIAPPSKAKTLQQLRYIHGVVFKIIADELGWADSREIKFWLKKMFLRTYKEHDGKEYEFIPSLEDLKVGEMAEFIDKCILFAAERGIVIPSSDEVGF